MRFLSERAMNGVEGRCICACVDERHFHETATGPKLDVLNY